MSKLFDQSRRQIIKLSGITILTLVFLPVTRGDELTDLIGAKEEIQIIAIRIWPSSIYTRFTLEADDTLDAKYSTSIELLQLIIDINNTKLNTVLSNIATRIINDDPIIANVKAFQMDDTTVRIIIFLKQKVNVQTRVLLPVSLGRTKYGYRFVLDMYPLLKQDNSKNLNDDILALLQLQDSNDEEAAPIPVSSSVPITQKSIAKNPLKADHKLLIMLDPGHGGEDPGAIGPKGTHEKDIVLDIGLRLYNMINSSDDMHAMLTRDQDIFVPLGSRVAIARKAKADVFVSIHADAFTTPDASGASVFVLSDRGASSSFAKWLAKTQNDADLIGGMSYQSKDKIISKILLDMTQTWTIKKSIKLGQALLGGLSTIGKLHSKQIEKAAFAVLKAPDIPSVLVETAFISNPDEELLLLQSGFRQKLANAIFSSLDNFVKTYIKNP